MRLLNQLPSYENMASAYEFMLSTATVGDWRMSGALKQESDMIHLHNDNVDYLSEMEKVLSHRKERMFLMIVNLLRMRPQIFMEQISAFKTRCDLR